MTALAYLLGVSALAAAVRWAWRGAVRTENEMAERQARFARNSTRREA